MLVDTATTKVVQRLKMRGKNPEHAVFSPDGRWLYVSSEEADVEKGMISTTSPIGRALLNRKVGDEVQVLTPAGKKEFEIVRLFTIHEEA